MLACLRFGVSGGVFVAWRMDAWEGSEVCVRRFSVTVRLRALYADNAPWWLKLPAVGTLK
jgi:hypothetical protein